MADLIITSDIGVEWKRLPGGTSTGEEFLTALDIWGDFYGVERQWNWWREGQADAEHDRLLEIIKQWDHAAPPPDGYMSKEEYETASKAQTSRRAQERRDRAAAYDEERSYARVHMLSEQATAKFMGVVLANPASEAQRLKAEELRAESEAKLAELSNQVGDPDTVVDRCGDLPATRRGHNLSDHMDYFRHRLLRDLHASKQRARFNQLLTMPPPRLEDMCSECQAPTEWHYYGISVCLWRGKPEPGSREERLARLIPGWLEDCSACTHYQLRHRWGGSFALPDFDGHQWQAMLTPVLRALFAPQKAPSPTKNQPKDRRKTLERRLATAEAEVERLRQQLTQVNSERDTSEG